VEGIHLLEVAQSARRLFDRQEMQEKRRLLDFVVSNCSWKGVELTADLRQPFDMLAKTGTENPSKTRGSDILLDKSEIWLGDLDSNQGCPGQSREFYR
jgi:site-specific DNA recombinase